MVWLQELKDKCYSVHIEFFQEGLVYQELLEISKPNMKSLEESQESLVQNQKYLNLKLMRIETIS